MNTYSAYKDSGEQWLGQIPEHWEMMKMKFCFLERSQKGLPKEPLLAATQNHGVILKSDYENRTVEAIKGLDSLKLVEVDDFVISLRSFQGGIERSYARGIISPAYTIIKPTHVSAGYFKYLGKSPSFISLLQNSVTGIREGQNIDYSKLKNRHIPLPPLAEQEAMVAYMDEQTGKIDAAIEREQKMIDLLEERKQIIIQQAVTKGLNPNAPMKDSGIDWIGEIPEGWEVKRMKHLIKFINGYAFDSGQFTIDGDVCVIRISNIVEGYIDYSSVVYYKVDRRLEPYKSQVGDLLIAMSGATTGKVGFDLIGGAYINQRVGAIRSNHQKWIYYWLNTPLFTEYINLFAMGSAQPNISSTGICNFKITCPSEEEQQKIVAYLDDKLSSINKAIAAKNRVITLLQERKQIIINEVVTGKIKVS